jgi:RNA polymerase sigma factor (sigma-70 family)
MMRAELPDAERFAALFRLHYRDVLSFARRRVGEDAAQEVVAETFLVAWRRLTDVPDPALPWLYQVARYEVAALSRNVAREGRLRLALSHIVASQPEDHRIDRAHEVSRVGRAFLQLNPSDQEILRLAAWEELSSKDGAQVLGCTVAAYRVRLHRARRRLARLTEIEDPRAKAPGGAVRTFITTTESAGPIALSTDRTEEAR